MDLIGFVSWYFKKLFWSYDAKFFKTKFGTIKAHEFQKQEILNTVVMIHRSHLAKKWIVLKSEVDILMLTEAMTLQTTLK